LEHYGKVLMVGRAQHPNRWASLLAANNPLTTLPTPPLPEIDEDATKRENEILRVSRERVAKALDNGEKLTLEDCFAIDEAVRDEIGRELMNSG
jgi:hypothetical protein